MDDPGIEAVSETLFLPLYALALESQSKNPIMTDPGAVALTEKLNDLFRDSDRKILRRLSRSRMGSILAATLTLRIRKFDAVVREFLAREPDATIVNLGCGLDDRRRRVDNGHMTWFDLDLPEVITFRKRFLPETDRFRYIGSSVLDHGWLESLPITPGEKVLFVAEGLFMYLPQEGVQTLVLELREKFAGAELVAEVANSFIVRMMKFGIGRSKLRRQFGLSRNVTYRFGIKDSRAMEAWAPGIQFLDDWSYFDDPEPKLGWLRFFGRWELFRRAQWTVHYRLGNG